jgi:hypothetical protein
MPVETSSVPPRGGWGGLHRDIDEVSPMLKMFSGIRNIVRLQRPARRRQCALRVESLDDRCLLDAGVGQFPVLPGGGLLPPIVFGGPISQPGHNGIVTKVPHFYEDYTGPKLAQLNAVAAAGELLPNGTFEFVGVNQGAINPNVRATYVWGIDRNGNLPTGPFPGRPNIKFDALVVVKLVPGQAPTASVIDLKKGTTSSLPERSILIAGNAVAVNVPGSLLPSTGLKPADYKFDYWPEDGLPGSTNIASFAPEFADAQVGVISAAAQVSGANASVRMIHHPHVASADMLGGMIHHPQLRRA